MANFALPSTRADVNQQAIWSLGEIKMSSLAQSQRSAQPIPAQQLRLLILKLRWIGLDDEAEKRTAELIRFDSNTEIIVELPETD